MTIILLCVGKTSAGSVADGVEDYSSRLKHYSGFEIRILPDVRNARTLSHDQLKAKESESILSQLRTQDTVVLLDESGMQPSSEEFSILLQKQMNSGTKSLVFIIGGAFGVSDAVRSRANHTVALSRMTLSHQLVRLVFAEQLYRAFTILRGEPYHHQ